MLRLIQRPVFSFGLLLIGSAIGAGLIHQISPLRDPNFEPNSANAGSLIPWFQDIPENTWLMGTFTLAALLASSLTWMLWQWSTAASDSHASQLGQKKNRLFSWRWVAIGFILCLPMWSAIAASYGLIYRNADGKLLLPMMGITALIATHFTFIFWLWHQLNRQNLSTIWHQGASRKMAQTVLAIHWFGIGCLLFISFSWVFLSYLLAQWLVD